MRAASYPALGRHPAWSANRGGLSKSTLGGSPSASGRRNKRLRLKFAWNIRPGMHKQTLNAMVLPCIFPLIKEIMQWTLTNNTIVYCIQFGLYFHLFWIKMFMLTKYHKKSNVYLSLGQLSFTDKLNDRRPGMYMYDNYNGLNNWCFVSRKFNKWAHFEEETCI